MLKQMYKVTSQKPDGSKHSYVPFGTLFCEGAVRDEKKELAALI